MPRTNTHFLALFTAALILPVPTNSFQTPLSDEAVDEAYFLGKRGGESLSQFLAGYTRFPAIPAAGARGPHVLSISFFTPFALIAQYSGQQPDYSAQQAEIDHRSGDEVVNIEVEITPTKYDWPHGRKSGSVQARGSNNKPDCCGFWKTFKYRIFDGKQEVSSEKITWEPEYSCGEGSCILTSVAVHFQFPAATFKAGTATIMVTPPDDESIS